MNLLIEQLAALLSLFLPCCMDTETMRELQALLRKEAEWPTAHYLATRIRSKTIAAIKAGDARAEAQFYFEEMCARTLYNLSNPKKPFEPDSPYWIIPLALKLARTLDIDARKIADIAIS
jgi:hypothetical protein